MDAVDAGFVAVSAVNGALASLMIPGVSSSSEPHPNVKPSRQIPSEPARILPLKKPTADVRELEEKGDLCMRSFPRLDVRWKKEEVRRVL